MSMLTAWCRCETFAKHARARKRNDLSYLFNVTHVPFHANTKRNSVVFSKTSPARVNTLLSTWFDMKKTKVFIEHLNRFYSTNVPVLQGTHRSEIAFRILQVSLLNSELLRNFLVVPPANQRVSSSSVAWTSKGNGPPKERVEFTGGNTVKRTLTSDISFCPEFYC